MRIPERLDYHQAACVCETYITAYLNIFMLAGLKDGETVLVHGGGGGVNTSAIQLCRTLTPKVTVIITASTGKVERVRALGAHHVIDYRTEDFVEGVAVATGKRGADVILDHLGGAYLKRNLRSLALGGRLVIIGLMGGAKSEINLGPLMVRRQQVRGSVLRSRPVDEKARITREFRETVVPLFADGRIEPLIHEVLPLEEAAAAHRMMESSRAFREDRAGGLNPAKAAEPGLWSSRRPRRTGWTRPGRPKTPEVLITPGWTVAALAVSTRTRSPLAN